MIRTDTAEPAIREIPLSRLALAPENVRRTPADDAAHAELVASIKAHGLLGSLVVRPAHANEAPASHVVVAGGRRLAALAALAAEGFLDADAPVPCRIVDHGDRAELSLAENAVRIAMHPADQVVAFAGLANSGRSVASIAARFGVSERTVERRLALGNAAPELLDAYRADKVDLDVLKAFAVTADRERQMAVWEQVSTQGYRPTAWQVKRLLTEERVPANAAVARFVGVEAYEAAGGAVLRDLFADQRENGVWFEDPVLLQTLARAKLQTAADELATRWKWAVPLIELDWKETARYGRIEPSEAAPTDAEEAEIERLRARHDELLNTDEAEWTPELEQEADAIEPRLEEIEAAIEARATFRPEDVAIAGCIVTVGHDGSMQVVQGLVRPEDIPEPADPADAAPTAGDGAGPSVAAPGMPANVAGISPPLARPADREAEARKEAGVGIGLADDLRAIRTALVKAHLAGDFEAAFDLAVFQMARSVFTLGYRAESLDIAMRETADRPNVRGNDDNFAAWSPGEAMLEDRSHLSLDWLGIEDGAESFAALRSLPRADKEALFAAAVARSVKGQLAFEYGGRPELEATIARLDIDFAKHVRPTADMLWSRIKKGRILDIARKTLGTAWASARAKSKKPELAAAMEEAFAAGPAPAGVTAAEHAAALAWTVPGFAAFDSGRIGDDHTDAADAAQTPAAETDSPPAGNGRDAPPATVADTPPDPAADDGPPPEAPIPPAIADAIDAMNRVPTADGGPRVIVHTFGEPNGHNPAPPPPAAANGAEDVPAFLRNVH